MRLRFSTLTLGLEDCVRENKIVFHISSGGLFNELNTCRLVQHLETRNHGVGFFNKETLTKLTVADITRDPKVDSWSTLVGS